MRGSGNAKARVFPRSWILALVIKCSYRGILSGLYSRISPGLHSSASQIASKVENRTAFAFPCLRIERLAMVMPTFSESSVSFILRCAKTTSRFTIMAIVVSQADREPVISCTSVPQPMPVPDVGFQRKPVQPTREIN